VFRSIPTRCSIHRRNVPTRSATVCRVVPGQPRTWTAAVTCPVPGCGDVTVWQLHIGGHPSRAVLRLTSAGAVFWDLPARPEEVDDRARLREEPLTYGLAAVLDLPDAQLAAAISARGQR
jgi:hypothetical protein